jgi:hypothetical protein
MTLDTVAIETPAWAATSRIVTPLLVAASAMDRLPRRETGYRNRLQGFSHG